MKELTIGEVARYAGIEASAIRYYESVGLLPRPGRINGRRRYDMSVLKQLALIQIARRAGFRISELQVLFNGLNSDNPGTASWQALAAEKVAELEALIERTQAAKAWLTEALTIGCQHVGDCVSINFDEIGSGMTVTLTCGVKLQ